MPGWPMFALKPNLDEVFCKNAQVGKLEFYQHQQTHRQSKCNNDILGRTLSMERNPFSAKNQTLRSYRVYISPTK